MKRKKALLYDPYLDVLGGGERHALSIFRVLEEAGYDVTVLWDTDLTNEIKKTLHIEFKNLSFHPHVLKHDNMIFQKLWFMKDFEIFMYVTDGGYFFSSAKNNYVFAMYPKRELYSRSTLTRLKLMNYRFISNSTFTNTRLADFGIHATAVEPYIDDAFLNDSNVKKEKIILGVGRFFKQLHAKRQDIVIEFFQDLQSKHPLFQEYKLVLAGGVKDLEDEQYLAHLISTARQNPSIVFEPNAPFSKLLQLYSTSAFYWHLAGFGVDENEHPENVEHFGITPLEAMAQGAIPLCFAAGGPSEIIKDGVNGYLFKTKDELFEKQLQIANDVTLQKNIRANGVEYVKKKYSYEVFKKNVVNVFGLQT